MIISLTSFPPRFGTLGRSLRCLLNQSVTPDMVILWVSEADKLLLPTKVMKLRAEGLEIRTCPDWRSLKKIAPVVQAFPDAFIATADDDLYYPRDWLKSMIAAFDGSIVARKARNPLWCGDHYAPISKWPLDGANGILSMLSGAGVIFPPKSLHPDVADYASFARLSPTCDDIWMTWQAARVCSTIKRAGQDPSLISWERTTANSLTVENFGANFDNPVHDSMVANLVREYGPLHALVK